MLERSQKNRSKHRIVLSFLLLIVFLGPNIASLVIIKKSTPRYEASGLLILNPTSSSRALSGRVADTTTSQQQVNYDLIVKAQISILLSEDVIRSAIQSIRIDRLYPDLDSTLNEDRRVELASLRVRSNVSVSAENSSFVIRILFRNGSGTIAAEFVNKMMANYLNRKIELGSSPEEEKFFQQQADTFEAEIKRLNQQMIQFSRSNNIWDIAEQKKLLLLRQDDELKALRLTEGTIAQKDTEAENIRAGIASLKLRIVLPPEIYGTSNLGQHGQQPRKPDDFSGDPPLTNIKLYQQLSSALVERNFESSGLKSLRDMQKRAYESTSKDLALIGSSESYFNDLQRKIDRAKDAISALNQKSIESRINNLWSASEAATGARILQSSVAPTSPFYPRPVLFAAFGFLASIILTFAVIYTSYLINKIRSGLSSNTSQ